MKKKFNQSEYIQQYIREKRAKITILCTPQQKDTWKRAAADRGKSLNRFIIDTVNAHIEKGGDGGKA